MDNAKEFVNNALNGDDDPSSYVDWLGKKTDVGPLSQIRFGIHIHTTDEDVIKQNAKEDGTVTDEAFWKQIAEDTRWLEENMATLAREFGLYVQMEGHDESGAYVGSAWIRADMPPETQKLTAKKILALEGDIPSTSDGTLWKFFYGSSSKLYMGVEQEVGAKYLDVMVEFTGTDALAEWLKLNIVESEVDADDPAVFVQNYRKLYYPLFYGLSHDAGTFVHVCSSIGDGLELAQHRKLHKRGRYVWMVEEGYPEPTEEDVILGSEPTGVVYDVTKDYKAVRRVTEAEDPDDPATFVQHFVPRMNGRLMIEFKAIKPHFPDAPDKNWFRETVDGSSLFRYHSGSEMREVMRQMHEYNRTRADHNSIPMTTYRYKVPNPARDVVVKDFLKLANISAGAIEWVEKTNAPIWFYMGVKEFNDYMKLVYPQIKIKEDEDADNPEGYLDRVTGWIDTFIHKGMTPRQEDTHSGQFWKKYECGDTDYMVDVHVRAPYWIVVRRTDATYGSNRFRGSFQFVDGDKRELMTTFSALDRMLTRCQTAAFPGKNVVDDKLADLIKQNKRDRNLKLNGRRKIKEDADDPPADVNTLLDKVSPEPCFGCSADLTQPYSVVRTYVNKRDSEPDLNVKGHYDPAEGYYVTDEPTDALVMAIQHCDLMDDSDTCVKCGKSTLKPGGRNESVDGDAEINPQDYVDQIHDLAQITHDIQNHGMFVNRINVWGRWVIVSGGAYWATLHGNDNDPILKADFFEGKLDEFMKELGITQYHAKVGQAGVDNEFVWFQLGIPKVQLEQDSWQPFANNRQWPVQDNTAWLPESEDADSPDLNIERHTADLDLPAIMDRLSFKAVHFKHNGTTYWEKVVGPRCFTVSRGKGQDVFVKVHAAFGFPQSWVDASIASVPVNELETTLNQTPYFLTDPNDPVVESVDPDDPSVNADRHMSSMDAGKILTDLGFTDREYAYHRPGNEYWEKFDFKTGFTWDAVRKSDDDPHIIEVRIYRRKPRKVNEYAFSEKEQIGGFKCHVGELADKIQRATQMRWGVEGDDRFWYRNVRELNGLPPDPDAMEEALEVPDPDAPEPNIEAYAQHVEKTENEALDSAIANALLQFDNRSNNITSAKEADELAVSIGTYWAEAAGYQNGSDEYDHIVSALSNRAGELFPGDWEDYPDTLRPPVQEGAEDVTDWTAFLDVAVTAGLLHKNAAVKYQTRNNPEANERIYYLFIEMDEYGQAGNADAELNCLRQIADIVNATNMRYGSAIKKIANDPTLDASLEEAVDDPDAPDINLDRHTEIVARPKIFDELGFKRYAGSTKQNRQERWVLLRNNRMAHVTRTDKPFIYTLWIGRPSNGGYVQTSEHPIHIADLAAKLKRVNMLAENVDDVDDPSPALLNDPFDVPLILKRRGYERHGDQYAWTKVFRNYGGIDYHIEVRVRGDGGGLGGNALYDTTLYHFLPGTKEGTPIAERYARNNKNLEPMLKALEARVAARGNKLRGIAADPDEVVESVDDPDDAEMTLQAHTQDLPADADEVKLNQHPHGEAEAELDVLGFEPSWIAGKNTVFGEPEIPDFWSKRYRSAAGGSAKVLFVRITPHDKDTFLSVRSRAMSIPVRLKPRSMAHVITIIKDVDAAVQRAADNGLTKEQEIEAIINVLDHHRQWCHPS